jgi:hypothetical protein
VFSFGVLIYEVITQQDPWEGKSHNEVATLVLSGRRMTVPDCNPTLQKLMTDCWHQDPDQRPDFTEILQTLTNLSPLVVDSTEEITVIESSASAYSREQEEYLENLDGEQPGRKVRNIIVT